MEGRPAALATGERETEGRKATRAGRVALAGILYRLRTGCQWHALPSEFSLGSTCHLRLQHCTALGVFADAFSAMPERYDRKRGIQWQWTALDGFIAKALKRETKRGRTRLTERKAGRSVAS